MKYLNRIGLILAALLTVQCTEEGDKLYPIVENPGWTAVAEDFVTEAPDWKADARQEHIPHQYDSGGETHSFP